jgi:predicted nucleotidyltransferase
MLFKRQVTDMLDSNDIKKHYPLLFSETDALAKLKLKRYHLAWEEAKKAGAILKSDFNADRTVLFGSLTDPDRFDENSDIDLAVSGISDDRFYAAVGAVTSLVKNFKIDLVDINDCKDYLKKAIAEEGIDI